MHKFWNAKTLHKFSAFTKQLSVLQLVWFSCLRWCVTLNSCMHNNFRPGKWITFWPFRLAPRNDAWSNNHMAKRSRLATSLGKIMLQIFYKCVQMFLYLYIYFFHFRRLFAHRVCILSNRLLKVRFHIAVRAC